jgi:hypothetical protein
MTTVDQIEIAGCVVSFRALFAVNRAYFHFVRLKAITELATTLLTVGFAISIATLLAIGLAIPVAALFAIGFAIPVAIRLTIPVSASTLLAIRLAISVSVTI